MSTKTLQPAEWARPKGYANGIAARGQMIFISGQIGWDANGQFTGDNLTEQVRQTLRNIVRILEEGHAEPRHLVRLTWYVLSRDAYLREVREIGAAYREIMGKNFPCHVGCGSTGAGRSERIGGDRGNGCDSRRRSPWRRGVRLSVSSTRRWSALAHLCSGRAVAIVPADHVGSVRLASRTWVPAMVPWRASEDGDVTPSVLAWYERFARGRPAALVVEATGVRDVASGPLLRISHDRYLPGLERLTECVRRASNGETKLFIQIIDFLSIRRRPTAQKYFERFLQVTPRHREFLHMPDSDESCVRRDWQRSAIQSWKWP